MLLIYILNMIFKVITNLNKFFNARQTRKVSKEFIFKLRKTNTKTSGGEI